MLWVHALFVGLLVGTEAFFTWLSVLNLRHAKRTVAAEREWLAERLGVHAGETAPRAEGGVTDDELLAYQRAKTGLSLLRSWVGLAVLLLVVYGGPLEAVVGWLEGTGLAPVARGTAFFVAAAVALRAFSVPFDAVDTFVVEETFGFNQQSPPLWVRDLLVGTAVSLPFVAALGAAVLWFVTAFPTLWPAAAWLLFVGFSVAMLVVYPRFIAPLFNDFEPVEGGDLREAVTDVFERAGFSCSQIYVMDASRRSSHSNAYFVGFGRTKRVVLFDTLVDQMELPEIQSVLAHELAHWKRAHIWKQFAASTVRLGVTFAVLGYLASANWLYASFGLPAEATYAGLLLSALFLGPALRLSAPLEHRLSLAHEREADAFAADVMGGGEPLADALARLASENLSNPFPHPLYATFHYDHPPIPERMRRLRDAEGGEGEAVVADPDGAGA